jgi:hypothetical protein
MNIKLKITTKPKRKTGGIILGVLLVVFGIYNFVDVYLKSHKIGFLLTPVVCLVLGIIVVIISLKKRTKSVYEFKNIEAYEIVPEVVK